MKRIFISLFLLLSSVVPVSASALLADTLSAPLHYVPGKQVYTWDYDLPDFRQRALAADPDTEPEEITAGGETWNDRQYYIQQWRSLLPELNVVGGGGDEIAEVQGFPSLYAGVLAATLFLVTGEASYPDFVERSVYNAASHTLTDSLLPADVALDRSAAAQWLMCVPGMMYAHTDDGADLYVNLYTNATAQIELRDRRFILDQITDMPRSGQVKFRLSKIDSLMPLRIHLRVPGWVTGRNIPGLPYAYEACKAKKMEIYVNGHEWFQTEMNAAGYVVIEREWKSMDEIFISFPYDVRYLRRTGVDGKPVRGAVACQRGPLVYALPGSLKGLQFSTQAQVRVSTKTNDQGYSFLTLPAFRSQQAKQDAKAEEVTLTAEPYSSNLGGAVWWPEAR